MPTGVSLRIIFCQNKYEIKFLNERIFSPCEDYPDNSMDSIFDMSNCNIEQTDDGKLVVNGHSVIVTTIEDSLPVTFEVYKKVDDEWKLQPYTQKRPDACGAMFGKSEPWHPTLRNTPEEQLSCPFTEGQRLDFDITETLTLSIPLKNGEGEYKVHGTAGNEGEENFLCLEIFANLEKADI
ncbi:uncharacterized protein ACRADG_011128 [Cochliomyia hominivorax]